MAALDQINRGTQQQAAATQQTSAALAQIEKSAGAGAAERQPGQRAHRQDGAGLKAERRRGREAGEAASRPSLDDTRASLATIGRLEAVGRNIEKIVDAISLVVVQTSMLAVSGSVEAARAGESGRGFAVVSNDIRSLAREASESADKIKETVGGILDQIASLRRDLEQIVDSVEVEVQNNRTVLAAFEKVEPRGRGAGQRQRSDPARRRADPGRPPSNRRPAPARSPAAAEEASAASRQAATASTEQAQGAEDLAAAIEEIASLADELKQQNG